jgi:Protein of unknown function (DUF1254)
VADPHAPALPDCLRREPAPIDNQTVIRLNRDTLYGGGVFDLDAGPVTITLPDAGKRFMSLQIINQDEYTPAVYYGAGSHTLTKEEVGTRYVVTAVRILVDPNDPRGMTMVRSRSNSANATAKFQIACRPRRAGTIRCGSIAPVQRFWTAAGRSSSLSR